MSSASTGTTAAAAASAHIARQPLDDVMLAMDVVDTLRRRERIVRKELDETGREEDLRARLKRIYSDQGIDVPDHVIEQGVKALKEGRFIYKPPESSLSTRLARIYVSRGRWGKWVGGLAGAGVLAAGINYFMVIAPNAALPDDLAALYGEVAELATTERAEGIAEQIYRAGESALRNGDTKAATQAVSDLDKLRMTLEQAYTIRVVNRPGEQSGIYRIPDVNQRARNYYLIVEAVDSGGRILTVPVVNEETKNTLHVDRWGLRVDEQTFNRVAADKRDDGIIERDRVGYKPRGAAHPTYEIDTPGGAITRW